MKTDPYTEKLFCAALLKSGTDVTSKVLTEYLELRDSKKFNDWLESIAAEQRDEPKKEENAKDREIIAEFEGRKPKGEHENN